MRKIIFALVAILLVAPVCSARTYTRKPERPAFLPASIHDHSEDGFKGLEKGSQDYEDRERYHYSYEASRFAQEMLKQKHFHKALIAIDRAIETQPQFGLNKDEISKLEYYRFLIYAGLAQSSPPDKARPYDEMVIEIANKGLKGAHPFPFYLPKIDALIALGRKAEAISCCQVAYKALVDAKEVNSLAVLSATLVNLTGKDRPAGFDVKDIRSEPKEEMLTAEKAFAENTPQAQQNILKLKEVLLTLTNFEVAPTQKKFEELLGAKFETSFPDEPNLIRRGIANGVDFYKSADLKMPHKVTSPTAIIIYPKGETDFVITEAMIRQWFGKKIPLVEKSIYTYSLIYEYPWGEADIAFSPFLPKAVYQVACRWSKSSECDGLVDPFEGPQPTVADYLKLIDAAYARGDREAAFDTLYWRVASHNFLADQFPSFSEREALRQRLITWKINENKPGVVAYLETAPYQEIVESMKQIIFKTRTEFFTADEQKHFKYKMYGEMDKNFEGQCIIQGLDSCRIIAIEEDTPAGRLFFKKQKISLPFSADSDGTVKLLPLNGRLIDQIAEQQARVVARRVAQRDADEKARYDEDSKDPEITKQRIIDARRNALDPERSSMKDGFAKVYKRLK